MNTNETTTFQVISALPTGDTITRDFTTQTEARTYYTTEVAKNTDGRTITISETTTKTIYRLHIPSNSGYSIMGVWLTEAEANADALALANEFPGSYIAKHTTTYSTQHTI